MSQAFSNTKQNLFSTIFVTTKEHSLSQNNFSYLSTPTILQSSIPLFPLISDKQYSCGPSELNFIEL